MVNEKLKKFNWCLENNSFNPLNIPNIQFWLDASDPSTITSGGGGSVSKIVDKTGNGFDFQQATGTLQPIWNLVDQITFDGVDDYLQIDSKAAAFGSNVGTIFALWNVEGFQNRAFHYKKAINYGLGIWNGRQEKQPNNVRSNGGDRPDYNHIVMCGQNGIDTQFYANNINIGNAGAAYTVWFSSGGTELRLEFLSGGGSFKEIFAFNRYLTPNEINNMFTYMNKKWSVY